MHGRQRHGKGDRFSLRFLFLILLLKTVGIFPTTEDKSNSTPEIDIQETSYVHTIISQTVPDLIGVVIYKSPVADRCLVSFYSKPVLCKEIFKA